MPWTKLEAPFAFPPHTFTFFLTRSSLPQPSPSRPVKTRQNPSDPRQIARPRRSRPSPLCLPQQSSEFFFWVFRRSIQFRISYVNHPPAHIGLRTISNFGCHSAKLCEFRGALSEVNSKLNDSVALVAEMFGVTNFGAGILFPVI